MGKPTPLHSLPTVKWQQKWEIDYSNSSIGFSVKNFNIFNVKGKFTDYSSNIETHGPEFTDPKITLSIKVESIDTNIKARDRHLRSDEFFNVEQYSTIKFSSNSFKQVNNQEYQMEGDLTIKDVTRSTLLEVKQIKITDDFIDWSISGELDRRDFNLIFTGDSSNRDGLVGDLVKLKITIRLRRV
ncbi:YceI family protein [Xanthovirga aplysinae]|uniref:YceI family protein n=1 Tax=Xanthovirga aplysinae TaxID=2529853 RepID=UPI001CA465C8|nr:YceI family protein [Xanthovirga aplysinae]